MADAPELVPSPLSPDYSRNQSPPIQVSPQSEKKSPDEPGTRALNLAYGDEKEALSNDEKKSPHDPGARALALAYGDEKQVLSDDEIAPKIALTQQPETEEKNPKIGYEHDDRAGSGMESARGPVTSDAKEQDTTEAPASSGDNDWHFGFWESFKPSSLCFESVFCPCVLTGRTHLRLHEPDNIHFPSTNAYCAGCFGLTMLGIGALPLFCFMTTAQRREVRHRYNIKGNNGEDCWKATFFAWCSLVQEEREVVWREEQKKLVLSQQLGKRDEAMVYAKT